MDKATRALLIRDRVRALVKPTLPTRTTQPKHPGTIPLTKRATSYTVFNPDSEPIPSQRVEWVHCPDPKRKVAAVAVGRSRGESPLTRIARQLPRKLKREA